LGETQQNNCHSELVSASEYLNHPTPTLPVQGGRMCAFTLAEVLITLVIIGVIAAITVPTLITKYQKEQTVTRLKKNYGILNNAFQLFYTNNGQSFLDIPTNYTLNSIKNFVDKNYLKYFNVMKTCDGFCENYTPKYLNGEEWGTHPQPYTIILQDGTYIIFNTAQAQNSSTSLNGTVYVFADINGNKKPNIFGKDIFRMCQIRANAPNYCMPPGVSMTNRHNLLDESDGANCNKNKRGTRCLEVIKMDSWQIKDDYPW